MLNAAIDAGSNTMRLLLGRVVDGRIVPERYQRRICRLAGDFSPQRGLSAEARQRALAVFFEFAEICRSSDVQRIRVVGTAAFRQAVNGEAFANLVREATGLPLEIISGAAEAFYTSHGVLSALDPMPVHTLIFDIGGGSTEFILCVNGEIAWSRTFPLGVVHLTESCLSPVQRQGEIQKTLDQLHTELEQACLSVDVNISGLTPVGTAGTVTTLAALDMQMSEYDWRLVNNHSMTSKTLQKWYTRLCPMTPKQREALPGMEAGRGDLIIAGLEIVLALLQVMSVERMIVSDFGILEGLILAPDDEISSRPLR